MIEQYKCTMLGPSFVLKLALYLQVHPVEAARSINLFGKHTELTGTYDINSHFLLDQDELPRPLPLADW